MFTTPCHIKKNSKELRDRLKKLGYHKVEWGKDDFEKNDVLTVATLNDNEPIYAYTCYDLTKHLDYIDCRTNEKLFLAIAALRDDSDINQWFVLDTNPHIWLYYTEHVFREFDVNIEMECFMPITGDEKWHKASVEELINHFKDK